MLSHQPLYSAACDILAFPAQPAWLGPTPNQGPGRGPHACSSSMGQSAAHGRSARPQTPLDALQWRQSFAEPAVGLRLCKIRGGLPHDPVGLAELFVPALQRLQPGVPVTGQTVALTGVSGRLNAPGA